MTADRNATFTAPCLELWWVVCRVVRRLSPKAERDLQGLKEMQRV